ncbi:uncharacterized protein ELE39_003491 [Cryptosporidium sp. chipmunk genotype I]|uniref:uncharacterized protein n=1 Tax=Cryptosporidium sp. chipmunk genotype I TaxID=1280935 RepID=UPI00351A8396|nr:hypothetical protein ELE39_003491 [Cryptosporidium sp. chipmunk genotype I]
MFKFNSSIKPQDVLGNIFSMRHSFNNNQLHSHSGSRGQVGSRNEIGAIGYNSGIGFVNHQKYLEQVIKYQQVQLQQQQQQLLLTQQQYEYNLQLQYQYQIQHQLNQSSFNIHQNPHLCNQTTNINGVATTALDSQTHWKAKNMYPGSCYSKDQEELQVLEPYKIIIIPKRDNTVTVRDVSHVDLSKNNSSIYQEIEVEVEIKKGDKDIELQSIRDELLSEKKISVSSDTNQEIEVNVYETRNFEEVICSEDEVDRKLNDFCYEPFNNRNIEIDLKECYNHEIQDEQILGSESEFEEVSSHDNQGEIEIEEDSILVIKYKNNVGTDILDLMEQNIDNCVIDGNSYYYENFVRSFSSGDYSSYESQIESNLMGLGGNYCYVVNNDSLTQSSHSSKLVEILEDEEEEQEEKDNEDHAEKAKREQEFKKDTQTRDEKELNTKSATGSPKNGKESLEELNEKIQRFNLLLEKINKMEQMNISFKEAFLSEKWNLNSSLVSGTKDLVGIQEKPDESHLEDDKSISEYSALETVKDIYDSNSHIIYKEIEGSLESSSERLADVESEFEQGEEHVQKYIQAINDYFAREGLLGVCESRLNTHRWERNYENAMSSLNSQFKDLSLNSDVVSESGPESVAASEAEFEVDTDKNETKEDKVKAGVSGEYHEDSLAINDKFMELHSNNLVKGEHILEEKLQKQDLIQLGTEQREAQRQNFTESSQFTTTENSEAHLLLVNPISTETEMSACNSASRTVLVPKTRSMTLSNSTKGYQKVKIPMINIPNSHDSPKKTFLFNSLKKPQNDLKIKGKTFLHASSIQKNVNLAGNDSNKELIEKDDEILARLSQCRVVNSKTIKLATSNNNNSFSCNPNYNMHGSGQNTINFRPRMNTCSVTFSSSNNSSSTNNHFSQHATKRACEKMTRGPVYSNSLGGKILNNPNRLQAPVQVRKEPNLGFKSLISSGIKVNVAELMKPRVIRK